MALPGLSFDVVRRRGDALGIRSDRTALIGLFERGPVETPVPIRSREHFHEVFGCPVDGMLGPLAAQACFENGAELLVVVRVVPALEARRSVAALPLLALSAGARTLPIEASAVGAYGDRIEVTPRLSIQRVATVHVDRVAGAPPEVRDTPVARELVDRPLRLWTDPAAQWTTIRLTGGLLSFVPPLATDTIAGAITAEAYAPTFALRVNAPGVGRVEIADLDLRDVVTLRERLAASPITLATTAIASPDVDLPDPSTFASLEGGADGLSWPVDPTLSTERAMEELAESFRRAIRALETEGLADVVIAPDLWGRIWRTKGIDRLSLDAADAIALGDELVRHAARMRERVVLLDAPLTEGLAPLCTDELEQWRVARTIELAEDRDFAAALAPWLRIPSAIVHRGDRTMLFPPSPHVAGRMARTARERAPWIATGNVALEGAIGVANDLSVAERERLQAAGIVPLEVRRPEGATIQGVRSLAHPDRPAWRYLSTRRLFNFLRRALLPIGRSYAFEPNSVATWIALRRDLEALLVRMFQRGAFAGNAPEEAFFVHVDESINPESERDRGVLHAEIGVAPAVPLEFLVVHLMASIEGARLAEAP